LQVGEITKSEDVVELVEQLGEAIKEVVKRSVDADPGKQKWTEF